MVISVIKETNGSGVAVRANSTARRLTVMRPRATNPTGTLNRRRASR